MTSARTPASVPVVDPANRRSAAQTGTGGRAVTSRCDDRNRLFQPALGGQADQPFADRVMDRLAVAGSPLSVWGRGAEAASEQVPGVRLTVACPSLSDGMASVRITDDDRQHRQTELPQPDVRRPVRGVAGADDRWVESVGHARRLGLQAAADSVTTRATQPSATIRSSAARLSNR
jgi:hypothetical protein